MQQDYVRLNMLSAIPRVLRSPQGSAAAPWWAQGHRQEPRRHGRAFDRAAADRLQKPGPVPAGHRSDDRTSRTALVRGNLRPGHQRSGIGWPQLDPGPPGESSSAAGGSEHNEQMRVKYQRAPDHHRVDRCAGRQTPATGSWPAEKLGARAGRSWRTPGGSTVPLVGAPWFALSNATPPARSSSRQRQAIHERVDAYCRGVHRMYGASTAEGRARRERAGVAGVRPAVPGRPLHLRGSPTDNRFRKEVAGHRAV